MRRYALASALVLVFALFGLAGTVEGAFYTVGGNQVIDRPNVDSSSNFYMVDKNHPFNGNGNVTEWEVWAENTNQVQLVVYRYSNGWSVVGTSSTVTPTVGYNRFQLSNSIAVQQGDYVGLYFPGSGSVSYSQDGNSSLGNLSGSVLFTSSSGGQTNFSDSSNRVYSVLASSGFEEDNEPQPGPEGMFRGHRNFTLHLSGGGAGVDTNAQGQVIFHLSKDGSSLSYKLIVANIHDVTGAQIYLGSDTSNVAVWLYPADRSLNLMAGRFQGILAAGTITADDLVGPLAGKSISDLIAAIQAGDAYVNVLTSDHTSGEIRGRLGFPGQAFRAGQDEDEADEDSDEGGLAEDITQALGRWQGLGGGNGSWIFQGRDNGRGNDQGRGNGRGRGN